MRIVKLFENPRAPFRDGVLVKTSREPCSSRVITPGGFGGGGPSISASQNS